jgi:hypothetical protein
MFQKATRQQARLRLGITGPSGSGKTYSALLLARGIGGKIACIDTEQGSASLYAHLADFDTLNLEPPYRPERFVEAVRSAEAAGYNVLVIDSITHEWNGSGGCLELVDEVGRAKFRGNNWSAWSEVTPRHRAFLDAVLHSKMHVIVTLRSKTETAQVEDGGRKKVVKLGMKSEQRDGFEYELTTVLDLSHDGHFATASKDRSGLFSDKDPERITTETGKRLLAWLNSGATPAPETAPAPAPVQVIEAGPVLVTDATLKAMTGLIVRAKNLGIIENAETYRQQLRSTYLVQSARDLTQEQADEVIAGLNESIAEREALATA